MRSAGYDSDTLRWRGAAGDGSALATAFGERLQMGRAGKETIQRRSKDNAQDRIAVFNQAYIDGEFAISAQEFFGAIQRIDQPKPLPNIRNLPFCGGFFRNGREVRCEFSQSFQNQ